MAWVGDIKNHLSEYKVNNFGGEKCWRLPDGDAYKNFQLNECNYSEIVCKGDNNKLSIKKGGKLKSETVYLREDYTCRLTYSEAVCINFFHRLLKVYDDEDLLKTIINEAFNKNLIADIKIDEYGFEHREYKERQKEKEFYKGEGTAFDFYVKMKDGKKLFWEIKYTENNRENKKLDLKKLKKYESTYKKIIEENEMNIEYLNTISSKEFYSLFQINRCIAYVRNKNEFFIFLIPEKNLHFKIVKDIIKTHNLKNVALVSWEKTLELMKNHLKNRLDEKNFYNGFVGKYFPYLTLED